MDSRRYQLVSLLADGRFHSGEVLARQLGVSRAAVWKIVQRLAQWQLDVYAVRGRGYRLATPLELLEGGRIQQALDDEVRRALRRLDIFVETPSTNQYLLQQPEREQEDFVAVFAEYQSAGRGRRGKSWVSPFGHNLYASLQWWVSHPAAIAEGLSLALGVGLARLLERAGLAGVQLKWPNDVHVQGRKIAGILLEMSGEGAGPCRLVIGIGLNLRLGEHQRRVIGQPCTDLLSELGAAGFSRNWLAGQLINEIHRVLVDFERCGLAAFRQAWDERDVMRGREVEVMLGGECIGGVCRGVDERGALLVQTPAGMRRFISGEASLRARAGAVS